MLQILMIILIIFTFILSKDIKGPHPLEKRTPLSKINFLITKCDSTRQYKRPNIYELSQEELNRYFSAIKKLNSGSRPTFWDHMNRLHIEIYDQVHSNPIFLPWHRAFLVRLERELQKIDPRVVIPYWDWTKYSQHPEDDLIFTDFIMGGDGNKNNNNCVNSGQFDNFQVLFNEDNTKDIELLNGQGNTFCLKRELSARSKKDAVWALPETINNMILNSQSYKKMELYIEAGGHGVVHNSIGSEFQGHASPNDPLFYSHHAFVDKLWFDWQKRNPQLALTYSDSIESELKPFGLKVKNVLKTEDLCYSYNENHFSWKKKSPTLKRRHHLEIRDLVENFDASNNGTDPSKYILKGIFAPASNDRDDFLKLRVPKPLSDDYLIRNKFNIKEVRQMEREVALYVDKLNNDPSYISESALIHSRKYQNPRKC